jgi:hypothetical protein
VSFAQGNNNPGGFLKIAHTKKKTLVQIFGPKNPGPKLEI